MCVFCFLARFMLVCVIFFFFFSILISFPSHLFFFVARGTFTSESRVITLLCCHLPRYRDRVREAQIFSIKLAPGFTLS